MTAADLEALDRRNRQEQKYIVKELGEIKTIAKSAEKAALESRGDIKEINQHLKIINGTVGQHETNFTDLRFLLRGDPQDKKDAGLVGEHIAQNEYIFNDLKPAITKLRWWFFSTMMGILIVGSLAGYVLLKP